MLLAGASTLQAERLTRERNQTLRFPQSTVTYSYSLTNAFGALTFENPIAIATPPGEVNRVFVAEQRGVVTMVTNLSSPVKSTVLDLSARISGGSPNDERGLLGLAFHPRFSENRHLFLFYSLQTNTPAGTGLHQRLSRFQMSPGSNSVDPATELPLITLRDEANNHNGGDLHFGSDGYLYITMGDEGNQNDSLNNSQRIDKDFYSGILRIDVDGKPGNLTPNPHPAITGSYWIPADNPFVGATSFNGSAVAPENVRTEFYAVGLRNPWRISFDPLTGELWCGDVGGSLREEINIIRKGGNYGWAFREGETLGPKANQAPLNFAGDEPVLTYGRGSGTNQGNCVVGGVVYRGENYPELYGAYIFGDYTSANIWALQPQGTGSSLVHLMKENSVSAFGVDPRNGDVLLADQSEDMIKRLVATETGSAPTFPGKLSETGAFSDPSLLETEPGIVEYSVILPEWMERTHSRRWFSIPELEKTIRFHAQNTWQFPAGTVWMQHF